MEKFINRELSLLEFNARVLAEAMEPSNPLLERLKFMGIVSSNLDEFFMVRFPRVAETSPFYLPVRKKARELLARQAEYFSATISPEMKKEGLERIGEGELSEKQAAHAKRFFTEELFPALTPIAVGPDKRPPALSSLRLYLVCSLSEPKRDETKFAVVEIPQNFPRLLNLPAEKGRQFMLLEDVVSMFAHELFAGCEIRAKGLVRATRAAELNLNEEADEDFLKAVEEAVKRRREGAVTRLEICAPAEISEFIKSCAPAAEIYESEKWENVKSVSQFAFQPGFENLKRPAWEPCAVSELERAPNVWELLRQKDVLIHLPYESFGPVVSFVSEAADDPDVLAIKQTLYRSGQDSQIAKALERAAQNGKQVTVLVELTARFDEENNIGWAKRLEAAGASVLYGVAGLKTHAKACLVVRREHDGVRRYAHLATGNYNEKTARLYSDAGLFTSREEITSDVSAFFNMITGYSLPAAWARIEVAPYGLRRKILRLIKREELLASAGKPGMITAKMNSLVDEEIITALYSASRAGVKIKLNVRGVCCLRPGVKDLSENIEVISVIDMFLEHSRIFSFSNRGEEEIYLSSADWMPRNLDRRVELLFPLDDKETRKDASEILQQYFKDNEKAWQLASDGTYRRVSSEGKKKFRAQQHFCQKAREQEKTLSKALPREIKPRKSSAA